MPSPQPTLITEDAFHTSYLLSSWNEKMGDSPIIIRAVKPENLQDRVKFHRTHAGKHSLSKSQWKQLGWLYGGHNMEEIEKAQSEETTDLLTTKLSKAEKAMVERYGVPELSEALYNKNILFAGDDLNAPEAINLILEKEKNNKNKSQNYYLFLDQLLTNPVWLERAEDKKIINAHSAILPYAPGMHSIEQVAASGDHKAFEKSAGATLHYVDSAIDSGEIIDYFPIKQIYENRDLAHVKSQSYHTAFDLLSNFAQRQMNNPDREITTRENNKAERLKASPFQRKNYNAEIEQKAEINYKQFVKDHRYKQLLGNRATDKNNSRSL